MKPNRIPGLSALVILLMTASQGLAQAPATTAADLQQRIRSNQNIRILLMDGRKITGSAQEVTDAQLRLRTSSGIDATDLAIPIHIQDRVLIEIASLRHIGFAKLDIKCVGILKVLNLHGSKALSKKA